jgi:hydrogenase expression/formation protein HypE
LLGLDPLYVAKEGKMLLSVAPALADKALAEMRAHPLGKNAAIIGEVVAESAGLVSMQTALGSWRIVDVPLTEQLPRIC